MSENKNNSILLYAGVIVALIGLVLSALLLCKQGFSGLCTASFGCSIGDVDGCKKLGESSVSKVFGFIPVAMLGIFYYSFLGSTFFLQAKKPGLERSSLLLYTAVFGTAVDVVLGYLNFTATGVPCVLCIVTYGITGVALLLAILHKRSFPGEPVPAATAMNAVPPLAVAAVLTLVISSVFYLAGSRINTTSEKGISLLAVEDVPAVIRDFNALKEVKIDTAGIRSREGSEKGYIIIQKFADFLCPHCLHASYLLEEALQRWPGRIQVVYRHFPLDSTCNPGLAGRPDKPAGDWRCNGAQAAICAADYPGFARFYHGVFDLQNRQLPIGLEQLEQISNATQIPWPALRTCMGSLETQQKLARDLRDARAIDIHSTPTLVVNNRLLPPGNPDRVWFLRTVDALVFEREGQAAYDEFRSRAGTQKP